MISEFAHSVDLGVNVFINNPILWICLAPFIIMTVFKILASIKEKKIVIRKKTLILIWWVVLSFGLLFINNINQLKDNLLLISI